MITVEKAELHHIHLDYVNPFETSFAREYGRSTFLLALHGNGHTGWAECVASPAPGYSAETLTSCQYIVEEYLLPQILGKPISSTDEIPERFQDDPRQHDGQGHRGKRHLGSDGPGPGHQPAGDAGRRDERDRRRRQRRH